MLATVVAVAAIAIKRNWQKIKEAWETFMEPLKTAWDNLKKSWSEAIDGIIGKVNEIVTAVQNAIAWLNTLFGGGPGQQQIVDERTKYTADVGISGTKRAGGGFVDEGELFVAREAGPEMVGTIGGRTAVANNDQIVEGIRAGVFEAVSAAMSNGGGNGDVNLKVYLDSREIRAGIQRLDRAWGA